MDSTICRRELEAAGVNVCKGYGAERSYSTMESVYAVRFSPALYVSSRALTWSHHQFDANQFTLRVKEGFILRLLIVANRLKKIENNVLVLK